MQPSKKERREHREYRGGEASVMRNNVDPSSDVSRVAGVREQGIVAQLENEVAKLNALLRNIHEGVLIANALGEIVLVNPLARKILSFGEHRSLTLKEDWAKIKMRRVGGQILPVEQNPLARVLRGELFCDYDVVAVVPTVGEFHLSFTSGVVCDDAGEVTLALLLFRDISTRRKLERQREEYLSLVSHDLRTPLTVIMGRAELASHLASRDGYDGVAKDLDAILRNARRMQAMLGDFLETSRLESGQANLKKHAVDLQAVVLGVIPDALSPGDQGRLHVEASPALPHVVADVERIERVITNLITNAVKFSEPNSPIEVRIDRKGPEVVVSVTDHGVGIAPEDLPRLFERYYQTTEGLKRRGQGLGLYLCRLIVEASGGRIWATSTVGQGSTFSFSVPVQ